MSIRDLECQAANWLKEIVDAELESNMARQIHMQRAIPPAQDKGRETMSDKEKKKAAGNESAAPKPEKTEEQIIMGSLNFVVKQQAKLSPTGRTRLARMLTGFLSEG